MNMISVAECAAKWDVAERTVRNYCAHDRIPGAVLKGKTWWIPENADRPERINKRNTLPKTLLERLQAVGSRILRTDELGTIVMASDGETIQISSN